jgi:hypothetical protein
MLKMNEYIREYTMRDYANFPQEEIKLDCSLGVNSLYYYNLIDTHCHAIS